MDTDQIVSSNPRDTFTHQVFPNQAMAELAIEKLRAEGWEVLPCDSPKEGLVGSLCFRYLLDGVPFKPDDLMPPDGDCARDGVVEETQHIQWAILGVWFKPDEKRVKGDELAAMLRVDPNAVQCDDPRMLLIGFVWYDVAKGISTVRSIHIRDFKEASPEDKALIKSLRKKYPA